MMMMGSGGGFFMSMGAYPPSMGPGGLLLPSPSTIPAPQPAPPAPRPVARPNPAKRSDLVTIGDRLFRAKNLKRAEDRYIQALKADPNSAAPYLRLALLSIERGNYAEAAERIRSAQAAEPRYLLEAEDIQTVYAEPTDFGKTLAKLEAHVQAHPNDRDAWLALGAELYLSGRVKRAHDIFLRLSDRKLDDTLSAFLDASAPTEEPGVEPPTR